MDEELNRAARRVEKIFFPNGWREFIPDELAICYGKIMARSDPAGARCDIVFSDEISDSIFDWGRANPWEFLAIALLIVARVGRSAEHSSFVFDIITWPNRESSHYRTTAEESSLVTNPREKKYARLLTLFAGYELVTTLTTQRTMTPGFFTMRPLTF